jgi:undecaprenyl-diphosphatase
VRPGKTNGAVQYLDDRVRSFVLGHRPTSWLDPLRSMVKVGATQNVIALAVVASLALLAWRKWRYALVPIVSVLGMDLMVAFLKHAIDRPGTKWHFPGAAAFPSGHMSGITALVVPFAVLAWTSRRQWWPAALAATAMLAMAVTLLVLDAHWFTDIVAGAVLTGTWATAVAVWLPARPHRAERGRRARYC